MSRRFEADHLVIGGGLAGSMAAIRLASAGCAVTLLERERQAHHKVCGEFLSREAVVYLRLAGIDPVGLGAQSIRSVRMASRERQIEARLPFAALSLSRCLLDEAMLARAKQMGCRVIRGTFVESLSHDGNAWQARLRGGGCWTSAHVFLASGKHDLRGMERPMPGRAGRKPEMVGFKLHWRLNAEQTRALCGWMDLFLFQGGYGGISLVEGEIANLCLVVRRGVLQSLGGWSELLASIQRQNQHLAERLTGAQALWDRPLAISSIPYGYLAGRANGLWSVGDQAAVIPSFTGDGMSIALHSGSLAAEMYLAGESAEAYHQRLHRDLSRSMRVATVLSRALVSDAGRTLAPIGLKIFPGAMQWIARATRIPEKAISRVAATA